MTVAPPPRDELFEQCITESPSPRAYHDRVADSMALFGLSYPEAELFVDRYTPGQLETLLIRAALAE